MAKAQWVASSQTIGQPPTGVTVAYAGDGHTLADWQIVESAAASGGKALKLMSAVSKLRMLWVDGVSSTGRVDVRARIYGVGPARTLSPVFLAGKSTGSGAVCYGPYLNSTRYAVLRKYTPTAADLIAVNGSGSNLLPSGNVWLGFRYTYDPAASPRHSIKVWREGFTTEESPSLYKTSDIHDATIDGDRIGFGSQTIDTGSLLDWITIGTDGDDADLAPTSPSSTPVAFSGSVTNQTGTEGAAFSLDTSTYFSGTETPFAYSVQAGTLPAGLSINSSTGVISGTPTTAGVSSGIVIRATDATPDTADTNGFSITINAANTSPSFTGPNIDNISGTEGVALTPVDVSAKFFDSESGLTFSAVGSWPAGVTVSSAGVISGTPTTAGTYASLQVRATDAGSLTADSNAFTITVAAPGDAENPTLTGSVTFASITQTSYTAQWPVGSDNVAVTGYEYQIGGTAGAWTDAGNNLSAAITGRTAGATETVYVRNYDAAGLRSTPAISGEVTLLAATASVTSDEFKNNTGTLLASATIPKVWLIPFGTPDYTNLVTNGAGELVISEAGLSGDYLILTANADGTEVGVSKATAS